MKASSRKPSPGAALAALRTTFAGGRLRLPCDPGCAGGEHTAACKKRQYMRAAYARKRAGLPAAAEVPEQQDQQPAAGQQKQQR